MIRWNPTLLAGSVVNYVRQRRATSVGLRVWTARCNRRMRNGFDPDQRYRSTANKNGAWAFDLRRASVEAAEIATGICVALVAYLA